MKVSAEISEPKTSPISRLNNVQALQEKINEEIIVTALRVATLTAQEVPVDWGTLRNSYQVHFGNKLTDGGGGAVTAMGLPSPPDKVTAVVGSVLKYAGKIERDGGNPTPAGKRKGKRPDAPSDFKRVTGNERIGSASGSRPGQGAFASAVNSATAGFPKLIATIVKNYLDGK